MPRFGILPVTLVGLLLARLVLLVVVPVNDTTEARYAEIARKMVELRDWVTPWHDYGVPFWAKPPFSFWATAVSFKLFGVTGFAARLPHLLMGIATVWLLWSWLRRLDRRTADLSAVLLSGSLLFFISAGAVMTDMALTLSVVLVIRGAWHAVSTPSARVCRRHAIMAFSGVALGLLAKGPVMLALVLPPVGAWMLQSRRSRAGLVNIPWGAGLLIALGVALPWYVLAERATPGFLEYFIAGEHWARYVSPGWVGDRYGTAHEHAPGTIWRFAAFAAMPWPLVLAALLYRRREVPRTASSSRAGSSLCFYLLAWAVWPLVLFTPARNVLWTYVLPALPPAAAIGALWLATDSRTAHVERVVFAAALIWTASLMGIAGHRWWTEGWKTARYVVDAARVHGGPESRLLILGSRPASASFYANGTVRSINRWEEARSIATDLTLVAALPAALKTAPVPSGQWHSLGRFGAYELYCGSRPTQAGRDAQ